MLVLVLPRKGDGDPELKVVSEMIEAGADILLSKLYDIGRYSARHVAEEVFRSMYRRLKRSDV